MRKIPEAEAPLSIILGNATPSNRMGALSIAAFEPKEIPNKSSDFLKNRVRHRVH